MRSNVEFWQILQDDDYFESKPSFAGYEAAGQEIVSDIRKFCPVGPGTNVVVIGCGYGRESLALGPAVNHVYGIDVNQKILDKAVRFLGDRGVENFTPIPASEYKSLIPRNIDLVYSIVVMQHLTRDLVRDYFVTLGEKLSATGHFVVQFLEELYDGVEQTDAELKAYEPSISWTSKQLAELSQHAGLRFDEIRTLLVTPTALWHWVHFSKG